MPLKIAAKIDNADREYYETVIKPLMSDPNVEFIGEIGESEKDNFWTMPMPTFSPLIGPNLLD